MNIVPLSAEHDRSQFDCGSPALNEYLKQRAGQHAKQEITRTYVALEEGSNQVIGYYSLCAGAISFSLIPSNLPHHPIPMILLARLAIDRTAQGQGLGKLLLLDALTVTRLIADRIGVYALSVDALNQQAFAFYQQFGFKSLLDDQLHLYLPVKTLRKLINS
jgi:ribosomal protein S18 acetylase RimI-like enzyme